MCEHCNLAVSLVAIVVCALLNAESCPTYRPCNKGEVPETVQRILLLTSQHAYDLFCSCVQQ